MNEITLIIKPDEEDLEAAEVFVDGMIGGHPYRFLLDSGAAMTSVILDDYTAVFDRIGKRDSSGVFSRHSDDLINVPLLELGPISKKDVTVARAAKQGPDGHSLIGMDILKHHCCHFVFNENRVLIDPDKIAVTDDAFQEVLFDSKFHPYVEVQFGSQKASAVWDTGAGITVVDINFIKQHPSFFQQVGQSGGTDVTGTRMETPMFIMETTVIGSHPFPPHTVAGVDLSSVNATTEIPMDLILGYSTLRKANWLFDFPGKRWAVSKMVDVL